MTTSLNLERGLLVLALSSGVAAPLHADVRYTIQVNVRETAPSVPDTGHPLLPRVRKQLVQVMAPGGSVEYAVAASADGIRIEFRDGTAAIPKGGVLLMTADGTSRVLDPATKTFWKVRRSKPNYSTRLVHETPPARSGKSVKVAGVDAERVTFSGRIELGGASGQDLPAELASALKLEGELWVTDAIQVPPAVIEVTSPSLKLLGLDSAIGKGLVVRQLLRGALLGNQEVETVLTDIDSKPIPPELMKVPDGYKEVQTPDARKGQLP